MHRSMMRCCDAVRTALAQAGLWRADARLLCAVSGGADSVMLLKALRALREEQPFSLMAVHVQHGLRGESSLQDEQFVRQLCDEWKIPLTVRGAGLSGDMHQPGIEEKARESRRRIFEEVMAQERCDAVLTAHHRDDQAETVLMHLLRGAGADGLRGMRPCVPFGPGVLLRPLLSLGRDELRQALGITPFREDESNAEAITARNSLRLNLLPQMEALFPGAKEHIAQAAGALGEDADCLDEQARALYRAALFDAPPLLMLDWPQIAPAPPALRCRMARLLWADALHRAGLAPDERALSREDTLALASGQPVNLPCGLKSQRGPRWLHILRQNGQPLGSGAGPCGLIVRKGSGQGQPLSADEAILTPEVMALRPVFRAPKPGDRIQPMGAPGAKALRRWMSDQKIDPALRPHLSVLATGSEILWIPGLCTSERLRMDEIIPPGSVRLAGAMTFMKETK